MIESLSTGCLVIGSDTGPVREVIRDGENGLLVDYFSPKQVADRIDEVLDHPTRMAEVRVRARETALERYSLAKMLPQASTTNRAGSESFNATYSWYGTRTRISRIFCSQNLAHSWRQYHMLHHFQKQTRCLFQRRLILLWNRHPVRTIFRNRQDACSTED